jgi:hypothetical protein
MEEVDPSPHAKSKLAATSSDTMRIRVKRKLQFTTCYEFKKIWTDNSTSKSAGITFFRVKPPKGTHPSLSTRAPPPPACPRLNAKRLPQSSPCWVILRSRTTATFRSTLPASSPCASAFVKPVRHPRTPHTRLHPTAVLQQGARSSLVVFFFCLVTLRASCSALSLGFTSLS